MLAEHANIKNVSTDSGYIAGKFLKKFMNVELFLSLVEKQELREILGNY